MQSGTLLLAYFLRLLRNSLDVHVFFYVHFVERDNLVVDNVTDCFGFFVMLFYDDKYLINNEIIFRFQIEHSTDYPWERTTKGFVFYIKQ